MLHNSKKIYLLFPKNNLVGHRKPDQFKRKIIENNRVVSFLFDFLMIYVSLGLVILGYPSRFGMPVGVSQIKIAPYFQFLLKVGGAKLGRFFAWDFNCVLIEGSQSGWRRTIV